MRGVYEVEEEIFRKLGGSPPRELRFDLALESVLIVLTIGVFAYTIGGSRAGRRRPAVSGVDRAPAREHPAPRAPRRRLARARGGRARAGAADGPAPVQTRGTPVVFAELEPAGWFRRLLASLVDVTAMLVIALLLLIPEDVLENVAGEDVAIGLYYLFLFTVVPAVHTLPWLYWGARDRGLRNAGQAARRDLEVAADGTQPTPRMALVREVGGKALLFGIDTGWLIVPCAPELPVAAAGRAPPGAARPARRDDRRAGARGRGDARSSPSPSRRRPPGHAGGEPDPGAHLGLGSISSPSVGISPAAAADDQVGDEAGPAGLVRRAEPGAVVAVEVLVEQDVVLPAAGRSGTRSTQPKHGPPPVLADEEDRDQPAPEVVGDLRRASAASPEPVGYSTVNVVAEEARVASIALTTQVVDREPDRAAPVRVAAEHARSSTRPARSRSSTCSPPTSSANGCSRW